MRTAHGYATQRKPLPHVTKSINAKQNRHKTVLSPYQGAEDLKIGMSDTICVGESMEK